MMMIDEIRIILMKALNLQVIIKLKEKNTIRPGDILTHTDPMGFDGKNNLKTRQATEIKPQSFFSTIGNSQDPAILLGELDVVTQKA